MAKAFHLQPLLHLAKQSNDAATKNLGSLNRNQHSAESKLEMLQQYRKDYQEKLQEAQKNGMELHDLRNFQDFLYRLDEAIAQQNGVVTQTRLSVQKGRSELMQTQRRVKSFDTLAVRHADAMRKIEEKMEQKIQDEHNSRRAAYNNLEHKEEN